MDWQLPMPRQALHTIQAIRRLISVWPLLTRSCSTINRPLQPTWRWLASHAGLRDIGQQWREYPSETDQLQTRERGVRAQTQTGDATRWQITWTQKRPCVQRLAGDRCGEWLHWTKTRRARNSHCWMVNGNNMQGEQVDVVLPRSEIPSQTIHLTVNWEM